MSDGVVLSAIAELGTAITQRMDALDRNMRNVHHDLEIVLLRLNRLEHYVHDVGRELELTREAKS
jgi:hypothetical protein